MIGQPIARIIPPDRLDEEASILERVRGGEKLAHFETVRRRKDGTIIPVTLAISPIRNEHGQIVGICKVARDISNITRARRVAAER